MLPNQRAALDRNKVELTEALKGNTPALFSYLEVRDVISEEERELAERKDLATDRLLSLFRTVKSKDSSWQHLLSFLRTNNQSFLANRIEIDAKEKTVGNPSRQPERSALEVFSLRLAEYYQFNYADVPTMGESPKHVKDVWVPLQMDGKSEDFLPTDRIDHTELLSRLKSDQHRNVALIKGDPGMGKTTLSKKIAYDWAVNYGTTSTQQFSLVLAVPLRSAGKSDRFDQLAIDYFLSILDVDDIDKEELIGEIKRLKSQLLIILDGLDEYVNYGESPFKIMFAAPFQLPFTNCKEPLKMSSFKLIITSRPYACSRVNRDFFPLRFVILPLDANHLVEFIRLYCQTPQGIHKVTEYLRTNSKLVIQVPLILTFVCYLADSLQEIPANMTCLNDSLVEQMIIRENREGKLTETVDTQKWKDSNVVKTTSELGFVGCSEKLNNIADYKPMLEFSSEYLTKCNVTNDNFICGFLLHKFVFVKSSLMAEFPHRSIQEFFAALHCYQLMFNGCADYRRDVVKLICTRDNQIGRFFFGICSIERQFDQMTAWLKPSLLSCGEDTVNPILTISTFSANLTDCYPEEHRTTGQILYQSVEKLEAKLFSCQSGVKIIRLAAVERMLADKYLLLSDDFKEALNFGVSPIKSDTGGNSSNWFLAENLKSPRLVFGFYNLSQFIGKNFDHIDFLIWTIWQIHPTWISDVKRLPSVKTLLISVDTKNLFFPNTVVTVDVNPCGNGCLQLTKFRLDYGSNKKNELLNVVEKENFMNLTVDERFEDRKDSDLIVRLKVTVNEDICQSTLIYSLIRLSLLQRVSDSAVDVVDTDLL